MPVAKLGKHLRAYLEKLLVTHLVRHLRGIFGMDVIPVYILLLEKAVMLVKNRPQLLERAARVGRILLYIMASRHSGNQHRDNRQ